MNSYLSDLRIAMERGDVDARDALLMVANMADVAEHELEANLLLTTQEREELENGLKFADAVLLDVTADVWASDEFAGLPTTHERI